MTHLFSFPEGCPDDALQARWELLLDKAPRLGTWLDEALRGRRAQLCEELVCGDTAARAGYEVERVLWTEMSRWLTDFESLPPFAVAAIATTLEEKREPTPIRLSAIDRDEALDDSPERSATELETLAADPAFALAFHCVDVRIRPQLCPLLPESAWFGLLHASAKPGAQLTAATAVALVLRLSSTSWHRETAAARRAALRLFQATPADLRDGVAALERLAAALPFRLTREELVEVAAASARVRKALPEASQLCAALVARLARRPGGLSLLVEGGINAASDAQVAELRESARRHTRMAGFDRLLRLL